MPEVFQLLALVVLAGGVIAAGLALVDAFPLRSVEPETPQLLPDSSFRSPRSPLEKASDKLGLSVRTKKESSRPSAHGQIDGFDIIIECPDTRSGNENEASAQVTVSLERTGPRDTPPPQKAATKNAKYGERGPVTWDIADEYRVSFTRDSMTVSTPVLDITARRLQDMAWRALHVASRVESGAGEPAARMLRNFTLERGATVRMACYHRLRERHRDSTAAKEAIETAILDSDPKLRLLAAVDAGDRGFDTLCEIVADRTVSNDHRIEALKVLRESHLDRPEMTRSVAKAFDHTDPKLFMEALRVCSELQHCPPADLVTPHLAMLGPTDLMRLAFWLGQTDAAGVEDLLLKMLDHEFDDEVLVAVAKALGQVGTVKAVEPLLILTDRRHAGSRLREAARQVIEQLQNDLGDVESGTLSLTKEHGGELSIGNEGGALSQVVEGLEE